MKTVVRIGALLIAALCFVALSQLGNAGGQLSNVNPVGVPKDFKKSDKNAIAVWYENGYWNIKVASKFDEKKDKKDKDKKGKDKGKDKEKANTLFSGSVRVVNGLITDGNLPRVDTAKKAASADWVFPQYNARGCTGFDFRWNTFAFRDSINFAVSKEATAVTFSLQIEGSQRPKLIMIGADGQHPKDANFSLPAHPR